MRIRHSEKCRGLRFSEVIDALIKINNTKNHFTMKKIAFRTALFFVGSLLTVTPASAQITHTAKGNVDDNAQTILSRAEKLFNKGVKSFSVTMVSKDAQKKQTGKYYAKILYNEGKYNANIGNQTIICDGTAVYAINTDSKEVVINAMSSSEDDLMNPGKLLVNWHKNFRAKYIRTEKNGDAIVDLTPKRSKSYYKIRLVINSIGVLRRLEMHNYDGSEADFDVANFRSASSSADDFTFSKSKYPGYEVVDMR